MIFRFEMGTAMLRDLPREAAALVALALFAAALAAWAQIIVLLAGVGTSSAVISMLVR
jgi:hypothetical protein